MNDVNKNVRCIGSHSQHSFTLCLDDDIFYDDIFWVTKLLVDCVDEVKESYTLKLVLIKQYNNMNYLRANLFIMYHELLDSFIFHYIKNNQLGKEIWSEKVHILFQLVI